MQMNKELQRSIIHYLGMRFRCMIECLHSLQYIALHQMPVEDWYKFANGLARHLHKVRYNCSSLPKLSTYRPL